MVVYTFTKTKFNAIKKQMKEQNIPNEYLNTVLDIVTNVTGVSSDTST